METSIDEIRTRAQAYVFGAHNKSNLMINIVDLARLEDIPELREADSHRNFQDVLAWERSELEIVSSETSHRDIPGGFNLYVTKLFAKGELDKAYNLFRKLSTEPEVIVVNPRKATPETLELALNAGIMSYVDSVLPTLSRLRPQRFDMSLSPEALEHFLLERTYFCDNSENIEAYVARRDLLLFGRDYPGFRQVVFALLNLGKEFPNSYEAVNESLMLVVQAAVYQKQKAPQQKINSLLRQAEAKLSEHRSRPYLDPA
jgi:hypothetical protein